MKGFVKVIIAGAVIIGLGIAVLLIALGLNGWSFTPNFEMQDFAAEQENTSLSVNLDAGRLKVEYLEDGSDKIQITYPTAKGWETTISENGGKLTLVGNKHNWYTFTWGVTFPETVIKIPKNTIGTVDITLNAGTVDLAGGEYQSVKIQVNAGTCNVGEISGCNTLDLTVNAGTLNVEGAQCNKVTSEVNAGSATIKKIDSAQTDVTVSAGSATLAFTGAKTEYNATVDVSLGKCEGLETQSGNGDKNISINVSAGSAKVSFSN